MFLLILSALLMALITMIVHVAGIAVLVRPITKIFSAKLPTATWSIAWFLLRALWWMFILHLSEIGIWGLFYWWSGCLPNADTAFYFSGVTYTTVGYGDVVLKAPWRLFAPVESLIGVIMCGLTTGFLFVIVSRIHRLRFIEGIALDSDENIRGLESRLK